MLTNQKHVFWEALLIAIFIFASGILLGYLLEQSRTNNIITLYQEAELNLLDIKIQETIFSLNDFNCESAVKETIGFADRIYEEAAILENYQESARFSDGIIFQYNKYSLLRTMLWMNAVKINELCPNNKVHIVVYFNELIINKLEKPEIVATQRIFSQYLLGLKDKYGDKMILIPISGNLEMNSINFLKSEYGITTLPTVLIDEKVKIDKIEDLDKIEAYLD